MGIETEYGITAVADGNRALTPDEVARHLFRPVVQWGRSSNIFLENGARLYLDVGSHPEYATAECDTVHDLLIQDRAGEAILADLAEQAQTRLRQEGVVGQVYLFKNNVDSAGNSYGCHENYLIRRDSDFAGVTEALLPFLISRQLICGAGRVVASPQGARWELSQRAGHVWEGVSSATTRSRPIINTRDEPHADAEHFRRMHVIVGDSNMTETSTMLKIGTGHLVLRLLEAGAPVRDLTLDNPIRSIRDFATDLTGRRTVRLAGGGVVSAHDIQSEYYQRVRDFVDREGSADPLTPTILDLWERTLNALAADDHAAVATEIDWIMKKRIIDAYMARHDLDLADPRVSEIDLAFHDINPARGVHRLLERSGKATRLTTPEEVETARTVPPQTTRARLRGRFLAAARAGGADVVVDWTHLKINNSSERTVLCTDPFAAQDPRVDHLIDLVTDVDGERSPGIG